MTKHFNDVTPAELGLLKALWRLGHGTVAEVRKRHTELTGDTPAYTTVMTLLGRLAAKGMVTVDKEREPYVYRPAHREASVLKAKLRDFIDTVFDGSASALVSQLVENETLSDEELERLERKLDGKPKRRSRS